MDPCVHHCSQRTPSFLLHASPPHMLLRLRGCPLSHLTDKSTVAQGGHGSLPGPQGELMNQTSNVKYHPRISALSCQNLLHKGHAEQSPTSFSPRLVSFAWHLFFGALCLWTQILFLDRGGQLILLSCLPQLISPDPSSFLNLLPPCPLPACPAHSPGLTAGWPPKPLPSHPQNTPPSNKDG